MVAGYRGESQGDLSGCKEVYPGFREYYWSTAAAEGHGSTDGKVEGRVINVSSNASWRYVPGRSSYAASKLAINSLMEYLDGEGKGGVVDSASSQSQNKVTIRSVALHPGGVDTDLAATLTEDFRKRILIDKPELAAGTCVYLSLPRADFLMGRFVNCTWDMEELEKHRETVESQDLLKSKVVGMFDTLPAPWLVEWGLGGEGANMWSVRSAFFFFSFFLALSLRSFWGAL